MFVSQTPKTSPFKPRTPPHLCLPPDSFLPHIPHLNTFRVPIFPIPLLLGLDVDGIYRVSGNLAVVQKLRFLVDRGERTWEEVMNPRIGYLRTKSGSEGGSRGSACLSYWSLLVLVTERAVTSDGRYMFPEQPGQGTYTSDSQKADRCPLCTPRNPPHVPPRQRLSPLLPCPTMGHLHILVTCFD